MHTTAQRCRCSGGRSQVVRLVARPIPAHNYGGRFGDIWTGAPLGSFLSCGGHVGRHRPYPHGAPPILCEAHGPSCDHARLSPPPAGRSGVYHPSTPVCRHGVCQFTYQHCQCSIRHCTVRFSPARPRHECNKLHEPRWVRCAEQDRTRHSQGLRLFTLCTFAAVDGFDCLALGPDTAGHCCQSGGSNVCVPHTASAAGADCPDCNWGLLDIHMVHSCGLCAGQCSLKPHSLRGVQDRGRSKRDRRSTWCLQQSVASGLCLEG
mmetsp:Transcript_31094/g.89175  ORF Transcript_31094/g.89175 Transcript_31094/m.89175 type:complete len:263 (-) Transcript_31094:347-1135(-)